MDLLLGGPGTGKTTALVNRIKERKPQRFALLSFTRQAANEAKDRLKYLYSPRDLDWVRTIHSFAFRILKLNRNSMFTDNHLKDFGNECGFDFPSIVYYDEEDGTFEGLTEDQMTYRQMIIVDILGAEKVNENWDFDAIRSMRRHYIQYKSDHNLLDFNDILKSCVNTSLPKFDDLYVDESQDLSPLQWAVVFRLMKNSKYTLFAGDDDQMIYEWAGVDRTYFMNVAKDANQEILITNYRLPAPIITKSQRIIEKCKDRIPKPSNVAVNPNTYAWNRVEGLDSIEFNRAQSYLILARNNVFLRNIREQLAELELPWSYLKHGEKKHIQISTIHGSKGAEADNIILFTDVTNSTYQNITSDSEHRVWYVGATRTKENLIIVDPQSKYSYEI